MPLDLRSTARRFGASAWAELELFTIVGGWPLTEADAEAAAVFAAVSHHHGERARACIARLPALVELPPEDQLRPDGAELELAVATARAAAGTAGRIAALTGALRVLRAGHESLIGDVDERLDAPTARAARALLCDIAEDERAVAPLRGKGSAS